MSNPTSQVASRKLPYGPDDKFYAAYPTGTADTFINGEMIGIDPSTGYGAHFDDTKALRFLGLFDRPDWVLSTDQPAPILLPCRRPRLFTMPLSTGNLSRGYQLGAPVYAVDSGHVQIGSSGLTYGNLVGYFFDIATATPETLTGATWIWISSEPIGAPRGGINGLVTAPATGGKTYGVEVLNKLIEVPNTAAETLVLPPIANTVAGDRLTVVKTTAAAFAVTLQGNAAETINGANNYATAAAQWSVAELVSDGTQWLVTNKI